MDRTCENGQDEVFAFLKERGVDTSVLEKENIDSECFRHMDDDVMKLYVPRHGDRLALLNFLRRQSYNYDQSKTKSMCLERLRKKLKIPSRSNADNGEFSASTTHRNTGNTSALKTTRKIELGWIHVVGTTEGGNNTTQQIRAKSGGGTRKISVEKKANKEKLLSIAKDLFFDKNGHSDLGYVWEFSLDIWDFKHNCMPDSVTVGEIYEHTGLPTLRFYLVTKCNEMLAETSDTSTILEEAICISELSAETTDSPDDNHDNTNSAFWPLLDAASTITQDINSDDVAPQHSQSDQSVYAAMGTPTVQINVTQSQVADFKPNSLYEALLQLSAKIKTDGLRNIINVTRHNVLDGAYRALRRPSWDSCKQSSVKFAGEPAMDDGGVMREFLTLAVHDICNSCLFHGERNEKYLSLNAKGLQNQEYEMAGRLLAYSLVHKGQKPNFMAPALYKSLTGVSVENEELPEESIPFAQREMISKINNAENEEAFRTAVLENIDIIELAGCATLLHFQQKKELSTQLKGFIVTGRIKPALEQFMSGLKTLGVLDYVQLFPSVMEKGFVFQEIPLTAQVILDLLKVEESTWSPEGSNKRRMEATSYSFWLDYVLHLEEAGSSAMQQLLVFVTGAKEIPVLGFVPQPSIVFRHDVDEFDVTKEFPKASTCSLTLLLPLLSEYTTFQERMDAAISVEAFSME